MRKISLLITVVTGVLIAILSACSSSSDSAAVNEFGSLAEATGPVTTNGSLSEGASQATTGVLLSSPGTFGASTSPQFCENVNILKEILREASQPDKILCYMGAMRRAGVIPRSLQVTDGDVHYIRLANLPDSGGTNDAPYVKFQIVKSGNSISSFKMWSCFNGTSSSPVQSEYMSQTFSGTTATLVSKNNGTDGTATYGSSMTATGDFESTWTSKNISGFRYYDSGTGSQNAMEINMDQYANVIQLSIGMDGKYGNDTYTNRFFTIAQLLGDQLSEFAIGDGSSKSDMSYDQNSDGVDHTYVNTYSWDGDTKLPVTPATNGDYYATAHAGTVPATPTYQTVSFSGAEAWNCSLPTGEEWVDADFENGGTAIQTGMQACEDKFLSGGSWISCTY